MARYCAHWHLPSVTCHLVQPAQDWQLPLGRRFRALKLWFVLRTYGAAGLRDYIGHKAGLASHFADLVRGDERFELMAPPRFGLVCFRVKVWNVTCIWPICC
jgi:glutamate/tyrosine decarboxylase-like PLP-dependent enzyme